MNSSIANFSRSGQIKIQQMAFMLVALVIFFAMVGLIYVSLSLGGLKQSAQGFQDEEAKQIAQKIASSPELAFSSASDCSSCIDMEKALMLKNLTSYESFWNLEYLMIEKVYPNTTSTECTLYNFPDCGKITVIDSDRIASTTAFVTLARWDQSANRYKYELGKIHTSAKKVT
jgi:type II secretory pathway pseudopilin PulG